MLKALDPFYPCLLVLRAIGFFYCSFFFFLFFFATFFFASFLFHCFFLLQESIS
ncbi:uncharacterized protein DS421_3g84730 [Arachis hypogaea]|nr:uncharacterized protein DS421_3g84730 [Arachis hypogaea]